MTELQVTCPKCGHDQADEDGDCAKCREPSVGKVAQGGTMALAVLARRINEAHENCLKGLRHGLQFAIRAGQDLLEAKGQVAHGEWISWVEANLTFDERTARRYMANFRASLLLGEDRTDLSVLPPEELFRLLAGQGPSESGGNGGTTASDVLNWVEAVEKLHEFTHRLSQRIPQDTVHELPGALRALADVLEQVEAPA